MLIEVLAALTLTLVMISTALTAEKSILKLESWVIARSKSTSGLNESYAIMSMIASQVCDDQQLEELPEGWQCHTSAIQSSTGKRIACTNNDALKKREFFFWSSCG